MPWTPAAFALALADLTGVCPGRATRWHRGATLVNRAWVAVRDELDGLVPGLVGEWILLTEASVALADDGRSALLTRDGHSLRLRLSAAPALPPTPAENQNQGVTRIAIAWTATRADATVEVHLVPASFSGCSPPRLAATRLPSTAPHSLSARGTGLSLSEFMVSWTH